MSVLCTRRALRFFFLAARATLPGRCHARRKVMKARVGWGPAGMLLLLRFLFVDTAIVDATGILCGILCRWPHQNTTTNTTTTTTATIG